MTKNLILDTLQFAQKRAEINGTITVNTLPRLTEALGSECGEILYALKGSLDAASRPVLTMSLKADVQTLCQRCLVAMPLTLNLALAYLISDDVPTDIEDDDAMDWLEPDSHFDLSGLIEEELLLALPIAPVHEQDCGSLKTESGEKANPFAVLKTLKR